MPGGTGPGRQNDGVCTMGQYALNMSASCISVAYCKTAVGRPEASRSLLRHAFTETVTASRSAIIMLALPVMRSRMSTVQMVM
jgi:hypothetical protein